MHDARFRPPGFVGPLLALLLIGLVEGLYDLGIPVISPAVLLLLPILYTATRNSWKTTAMSGLLAVLYVARHSYLNRTEYVSAAREISLADISRIVIFAAAAAGLAAIARLREQQREAQVALQEAYQNALAANRAKSEFLAVVSHELRTPLTTILQYADMLSAGIPGPVNPEQREMLRRIEDGAVHLKGMIQQLLDYAQLEAGRAKANPRMVDLAQTLRPTLSLLEPLAEQSGLELRLDEPLEACTVETDSEKVRQILLNLVENAIKFTEAGRITVRLVEEPGACLIVVSDTGVGIPPEMQERIFEPFWQGEDALTRKRGGFGLGLAITRELVAAIGGEISVESEVGRGTTFHVRLPRRSTPGIEEASAPVESGS